MDQVCADIDSIIKGDSFPQSVASTLRGRLQFAESQTFSRAASLFMKACHARSIGAMAGGHITDDILKELQWAKGFMKDSPPRKLVRGAFNIKNLIFTDAFLDGDDTTAGVGMVFLRVVNGRTTNKKFFSEKVPADVTFWVNCRSILQR